MVSRGCEKALSRAKKTCDKGDKFACGRAVREANEVCAGRSIAYDRDVQSTGELHGKCRRLTALSRDFDVAAGDFCIFVDNKGERVMTVEKVWLNEGKVSDRDFLGF